MDPSPATIEPPDLIPARMLNDVVYCPRLYYLIPEKKLKLVDRQGEIEMRA